LSDHEWPALCAIRLSNEHLCSSTSKRVPENKLRRVSGEEEIVLVKIIVNVVSHLMRKFLIRQVQDISMAWMAQISHCAKARFSLRSHAITLVTVLPRYEMLPNTHLQPILLCDVSTVALARWNL